MKRLWRWLADRLIPEDALDFDTPYDVTSWHSLSAEDEENWTFWLRAWGDE